MRKFYLENENGERLDLNDGTTVFLSDIKGLGANIDRKPQTIKNGFFISTANHIQKQNIQGIINFLNVTGEAYQQYKNFTDWLFAAKYLKLIYKTDEQFEYMRDVQINKIEKNEIKRLNLACLLSLECLTPWYAEQVQIAEIEKDQHKAGSKKYAYQYPTKYHKPLDRGQISFFSYGHLPSEFTFTLKSGLTDPIFIFQDENGELLARVEIEGLKATNKNTLQISNRVIDMGITLDGESVLPLVNLNNRLFPIIKPNTKTTLTIEGIDPESFEYGKIHVYSYYLTR